MSVDTSTRSEADPERIGSRSTRKVHRYDQRLRRNGKGTGREGVKPEGDGGREGVATSTALEERDAQSTRPLMKSGDGSRSARDRAAAAAC